MTKKEVTLEVMFVNDPEVLQELLDSLGITSVTELQLMNRKMLIGMSTSTYVIIVNRMGNWGLRLRHDTESLVERVLSMSPVFEDASALVLGFQEGVDNHDVYLPPVALQYLWKLDDALTLEYFLRGIDSTELADLLGEEFADPTRVSEQLEVRVDAWREMHGRYAVA